MDSRGQRLRNRERYPSCEEESPPLYASNGFRRVVCHCDLTRYLRFEGGGHTGPPPSTQISKSLMASVAIHLTPGELPPLNTFWSPTLYELPSSCSTPIHEPMINCPMPPSLKQDPNGGLILCIQRDSSGPEKGFN
jgi:hypothetical protein